MVALNPPPQATAEENSTYPGGNSSNIKIGGDTGKARVDGKKKKKGCC